MFCFKLASPQSSICALNYRSESFAESFRKIGIIIVVLISQ